MLRLSTRSALLGLGLSLSVVIAGCSSTKTNDTTVAAETIAVETVAPETVAESTAEPTESVAAETVAAAAVETSAAMAASAMVVPDAVKAKGSISFAMDASYPPFEAFDTDNKTIIGFDADLSDAIAAKLGVKAEHVNAGFDSILVGLAAGSTTLACRRSVLPRNEQNRLISLCISAVAQALTCKPGTS
jgi:ABC-type amino acid transport substrate-binding protein